MLNSLRNTVCLLVFTIAAVLSGCDTKQDVTEPASTFATEPIAKAFQSEPDTLIGAEVKLIQPLQGGTFAFGACTFEIPPNALLTPTLITAELRDAQPPAGLKDAPRRVFRFFPHGLLFQRNAILHVSFEALGIDARSAYDFRCYYYNEATLRYEPIRTRVDIAGRRYIVFIRHFSMYAFGR